jgi:serine protease Do
VVHILVVSRPGSTTDTTDGVPSPFQTPETTVPPQSPDETTPQSPSTTTTTVPDNGLPEGHPALPPDFEQTSEGSGVIIASDGYILTNRHVIENAETVTVDLSDGESYDAKVIGSDGRDDLALIKIEPKKPLPVAPLGDSDAIRPGDWVIALGNPYGLEWSVTVGVVSAKGRALPNSTFRDYIQTDAAIYPGNSGGPLFDLAGEVIGINRSVIPDTNLGFAVPINTAKDILPQLQEKGKVVRGYLGVSIQSVADLPEPPAGADKGAVIMAIYDGTPAQDAGLKVGDVVVTFDGKPVTTAAELTALVTATSPGARVTMQVIRDGQPKEIEIVVGSLPASWE